MRPADCMLIVEGKSYISGICKFVRSDKKGSFSIYGDQYWATVNIEDSNAKAAWNEEPYATHAQAWLGDVHRVGGCWEGPKVRICALALDPARRDTILASWPKGLHISPEYVDYLCVSARDYRFEPRAALVMDRCEGFCGCANGYSSSPETRFHLRANRGFASTRDRQSARKS